jgi:hypothetical protein
LLKMSLIQQLLILKLFVANNPTGCRVVDRLVNWRYNTLSQQGADYGI